MKSTFEVINSSQTDNLVYLPVESLNDKQEKEYQNTLYLLNYRHNMQSLSAFIKLHSLTRATNAIEATVVDHIGYKLRFNVLYFIQSTTTNTRYVLST